ncbi:putative serine/threonine-protein kinase drkA [Phytophthora citrophthora]|uniref:Serine/threonine-protein kinase drkA n=1 Tax=Phytophthora citrophthora TaxID=4793 RepID=A0AAD9GBD2_9STRA|nr:putative serine/threonine-protein kinase drkA [Phytophthora citrophthora]
MARKSSLAELLADHRRQEAVEEGLNVSSDHSPSSSSLALSVVPPARSNNAVEAQSSTVFPPRSASSHTSGRRDRDAQYRMERVYEEVSRRKSQVIAGPAVPRGSSETDSSATPPTSDTPLPMTATNSTENGGLRCTHHANRGSVHAEETEQKESEENALFPFLMPRPKDRKRPRGGVKRVGFTTPPHPGVSGPPSSRNEQVDVFNTDEYRRNEERNERRRERQERRRRRREKANRRRPSSDDDKGATLLDVDDATVQYIDAVLVKPDPQVFNKYTRFFLDPKLETLYQDFTAIYWFGRARWHVAVWMAVHLFVNLVFYALPSSGFTGMEQFILSYDSLPTFFQWTYIPIALPFAALPNKYNPFQTRWRSWVCLIIIFFNLTFQVWLADASRLATNAYTANVDAYLTCEPSSPELVSTFPVLSGNSSSSDGSLDEATINNAFAYLNDEQKNLAITVTHMCSDALVQTLVGFASLFSFLFVISIRLEFVQVVVVAVTGAAIYAIVVSAFGLQLQWLVTFAYGMAVVLLLILSYSTDRTNRRSFLSNFLVEKENENLKSSLKQAEAALQNDAAHADEERAVARVLAAPEMRHLEMVHIPFADLTFLQAIGRGSMGDVIKARYFGTIVVCKRMRREHIVESSVGRNRNGIGNSSNGDSALASFRDEIELMSCLRHPNIVQFIGASWDNASNLCIVMEYLENGDMHSVLHSGLGKNFTWADPLLKMAVDAVQGMLYLHSQERPVVHRDLKSVNILCSATFGCKVGDFGLSRRYKKGVDALTTLVGTPFWLAPEIIRSERYGPEADVYSFGIVLTELETRRTPYHDQEETGLKVLMRVAHKGLRPSLPSTCLPERCKLIEDCLRDIPAHRPTFAQVLSRLQGPVLLEIEGHVAAQPELERRVLLRRYQERRSL